MTEPNKYIVIDFCYVFLYLTFGVVVFFIKNLWIMNK